MESLENIVRKIKDHKLVGSKEITLIALNFLRQFCKKNGFKLKFEVAAKFLLEAKPTSSVLHNCIEAIKKDSKLRTIDNLIEYLETVDEKIYKQFNKKIRDGSKLITFCYIGEAFNTIVNSILSKKKLGLILIETSPAKISIEAVRYLMKNKIHFTLVSRDSVGTFIKDSDTAIVGCDAIRKDGVVCKSGSLSLAIDARFNKKPMYVVANKMKGDDRKWFKVEEGPVREEFSNIKGLKYRNPAFELVPYSLISGIITDTGVLKSSGVRKLISK